MNDDDYQNEREEFYLELARQDRLIEKYIQQSNELTLPSSEQFDCDIQNLEGGIK